MDHSSEEEKKLIDASEKKLSRFLDLARKVVSLAEGIAKEFFSLISRQRPLTHRERVSISLYKKMLFALHGTIEDAQRVHPVAMHHLKTLIEAYIYLRWMYIADTEKRAKLIEALACNENIIFLDNNKERYKDTYDEQVRLLKELMAKLINNKKEFDSFRKKKLKGMADEDDGLKSVYHVMYRFACQSAHIGDMHLLIPASHSTNILEIPYLYTLLLIIVTLDYSVWTAINTLKFVLSDAAFDNFPAKKDAQSLLEQFESEYQQLRDAAQ